MVAGAAAAACGRGGARSPARHDVTATGRTPGGTVPAAQGSATATPIPPAAGVARLESPRTLSFDTFDAARSGDLSTLEVLGRTCSRLIHYLDPGAGILGGDLAEGWEQPDELTMVLRVDGAARWQANGRAVTAEDVADWLTRRVSLAGTTALPAVQRGHDWLSVDAVDVPAPGQVRIRLARPDWFFLDTLAGAFALVQLPEVSDVAGSAPIAIEAAAGSGPFVFRASEEDGLHFEAWMPGHRRPRVERLVISQPVDSVESFRRRAAHEVTVSDVRVRDALLADPGGEAQHFGRFDESAMVSTMFVGAPPWNDLRLREALSLALYSRELIWRLVYGSGGAAGPVLGAHLWPRGWSSGREPLPLAEARTRARALWEAADGPGLGAIRVDFPNVFDPRYAASSTVIALLREALGDQFQAAVEPYTTIAERIRDHRYGDGRAAFWFGWGPPVLDAQPARHLYETYSSRGPNVAVTGFRSEHVDAALDRLIGEPTTDARRELEREAVAAIAAELGGGIMPWMAQMLHVFRWRFLERAAPRPWWMQHLDSELTVDTSDGLYRPTPVG